MRPESANSPSRKPIRRSGCYIRGDWGELCDEDRLANDQALVNGSRLLSAYRTLKGVKIWVITEAADDEGQRAATTCLLPSEY